MQRGRPIKGTFGELEEAAGRAAHVESLWQQRYAAFEAGGATAEKAKGEATRAVAEQLNVSPRRVQQLRRYYAQEVVPQIREWQQSMRAARPRAESFLKRLNALRELLTAEEFADLIELSTGPRLMQRLLDGAAAEKRVAELETEMKRLRTQLAAETAAPGYSAKRNSAK
jgi:hypothetical protein